MAPEFALGGEIVENEYASVTVMIDGHGNDRRLALLDNRTGRRAYFDALTLESLVWVPEPMRDHLLDPSSYRWTSEPSAGSTGEA